jgi:hypothetical protein
MSTNVILDDQLLAEARRIGRKATNEETAAEALQEYINRRKQAGMLDLFGTIDYESDYDHKKHRRRRSTH